MAKYVPKTYEDILQQLINVVVARSALTDLNETASAKTVLAAAARGLDEAYFQMQNLLDAFSIDRAAGADLDARAQDFPPDGLVRNPAAKSTGSLVFSRLVAGPLINIPIGTRIEVPGESPAIVVVTTVAGTIPNLGLASAPIASTAEAAGSRGNAAANTLTKFKGAKPAGVDAVTNPSPFVGGADEETDESFRGRIQAYTRTLARCTPEALEVAALGVTLPSGQRVVFAKTVEDPVNLGKVYLYIDDGAGTAESVDDNYGSPELLTFGIEFPGGVAQGGEEFLYTDNFPIKDTAAFTLVKDPAGLPPPVTLVPVTDFTLNPASGQIFLTTPLGAGDTVTLEYTWFTGLMEETQKVIDGDPADRPNYPGHRAAGVLVIVRVPVISNVVVTGSVVVRDGFDRNDVIDAVKNTIADYINSLGIGSDVIRSEIVERAMTIAGMFDFILTVPATNIAVLDDELPRTNLTTDITIT